MSTNKPVKLSEEATAVRQKKERLKRLGHVIKEARIEAHMSQDDLGAQLGGYPQSTVSRWERGMVDLSMEAIMAMERVMGLEHGTLGRRAGYVQSGRQGGGERRGPWP